MFVQTLFFENNVYIHARLHALVCTRVYIIRSKQSAEAHCTICELPSTRVNLRGYVYAYCPFVVKAQRAYSRNKPPLPIRNNVILRGA
ncbi:hypothetical protein POVWA2_001970 [Plasmodium ovale wallikeri]|uniref:Uncharacterized protein n=1 Tax=Plasmodium ovale wallikeri TaxID=864142 RepID=A0A1A8YG76_PLAOA|nr:hypothetical protein POVWA1_002100 [Plasmodium ovale wallikeri]SBT31021.1 hypothetical protein POVWA2_001970 [Plasmodium ovale wallikeri]